VVAEPDAGDIAAEVAGFRDLGRCVSTLGGAVPPALAEVLGDVGYAAAEDACRERQALASREIGGCEALAVRAARDGCRRRYAMFHAEPDLCPVEPEHQGRDPLCVAVAMRDHSMCLAVGALDLVGTCRAIILRDARPCRVAHETLVAAERCARAARRWWRVIPPTRPRPRLPVVLDPALSLCLSGDGRLETPPDGGGDAGVSGCLTNPVLLRRGIVVHPDRPVIVGAREGVIVGPRLPVAELRFPIPHEELPVELDVTGPGVAAWIDLEPAHAGPSGSEADRGTITLERFGIERGAIVSGSLDVEVAARGDAASRVRGTFLTFVRDVVRDE
jgi:hypothetical protein